MLAWPVIGHFNIRDEAVAQKTWAPAKFGEKRKRRQLSIAHKDSYCWIESAQSCRHDPGDPQAAYLYSMCLSSSWNDGRSSIPQRRTSATPKPTSVVHQPHDFAVETFSFPAGPWERASDIMVAVSELHQNAPWEVGPHHLNPFALVGVHTPLMRGRRHKGWNAPKPISPKDLPSSIYVRIDKHHPNSRYLFRMLFKPLQSFLTKRTLMLDVECYGIHLASPSFRGGSEVHRGITVEIPTTRFPLTYLSVATLALDSGTFGGASNPSHKADINRSHNFCGTSSGA